MIEIDDLEKTAKETGSEESIVSVYKNQDYEIWAGIRIRKNDKVDVFTAASIPLGFLDDCSVDLERLTASVDILWKLRDLGYCLCYCGNGSIYVERESNKKDVKKHLEEMLKLLSIDTANVMIMMNND